MSGASDRIVKRLASSALFGLIVNVACACGSATESASDARGAAAESTAAQGHRYRAISESGRFRITVWPEGDVLPLGQLHSWLVEVKSSNGEPADVRQLVFDGGMPQHAHGFETKPQVTHALGDGVYRVDGVRFHMTGAWKLRVDVAGADGADLVYFDVTVGP